MPLLVICCYRLLYGYRYSTKTQQSQRRFSWYRLYTSFLRFLVLALSIGVIIVCVTPVRNLVTYPVLPASWREVSTWRILGLYFAREKVVDVDHGIALSCADLQDTMNVVNWPSYVDQLDSLPAYDDSYFDSLKSPPARHQLQMLRKRYPNFLPPIPGHEQRELRLTFKVMSAAFHLFNVQYFLCEGSMLGAYRHHGFIPWDDDIDICVNGSDWLRVKQILHCLPGFDVDASHYMMYKFFWEGSRIQPVLKHRQISPSRPSSTDNPILRVPYIDIFFFTEDEDYIWAMSGFKKHRILYKKSSVFPLLHRPFETGMAPVPRDYLRMCSGNQYDASVCVSRDFDHINKRPLIPFFDYRNTPCEDFREIYPFVKRRNIDIEEKTAVLETLELGSEKIRDHIFVDS